MSDLQCPATFVLTTTPPATIDLRHVADLRRELQALADLYRGETVVVLAREEAIAAAVGRGPPVTVAIDASGWAVR